jgi:pantothenate kinase-related protein Tda10
VMEALNLLDVYRSSNSLTHSLTLTNTFSLKSWREEAEEEMRKNGHDAMSKQQVISFVDRRVPPPSLLLPPYKLPPSVTHSQL